MHKNCVWQSFVGRALNSGGGGTQYLQPRQEANGRSAEKERGTRATIEVHHFFSSKVPNLRSLRPLPQTDSEKNLSCYRMKNPIAQVYTGNHNKTCPISDEFWLRSPVVQKPFRTKSGTSIVARAEGATRHRHSTHALFTPLPPPLPPPPRSAPAPSS